MSNGPKPLRIPNVKVGNMPTMIRQRKAGEFYLDKPPNDVLRDWMDNNVRSHIIGLITSGFKTWYGVIQTSPNNTLDKHFIKIMWDKAKLPHNIKMYVGTDPNYKEWEYEIKLVEVCNITCSAKDGLTKFQLVILGDVVTLDKLKRTFVLS